MAEIKSLARPYAKAIALLANESASGEAWKAQLDTMIEVLSDESLQKIIYAPGISKSKKNDLVKDMLASFEKDFSAFMQVLIEAKKLPLLAEIKSQFEELLIGQFSAINITVHTAMHINDTQAEKLSNKIGERLGSKVILKQVIDESLIAGASLSIKDWVIDSSLKKQIQKLNARLQ